MDYKKYLVNKIIVILIFVLTGAVYAADRVIDLVVANKMVNFSGKSKKALAVNNQIPGPTLHFKQGDHVTINVHNLLNEKTTIHWHGILVPWQMDGVEGISQKGISPGGVFHYKFTLEQSGTYWYHAHAGLQEQEGLYGAFLIDPTKPPHFNYTKDYVVVLSDWSNTNANQILNNLKKEGDYYAQKFPLQPSLLKFLQDYGKAGKEERKQLLDDYKSMQISRMNIYDLSDVAYDAFLLNGRPNSSPWTGRVKAGDVVRLRFIGAMGSTIFNVKIPDTKMQMVHVQGNDVEPYEVDNFAIAPGETYDVLVKIKKYKPYIIYAESRDTLGAAMGALTTSSTQTVNYKAVKAFPEPQTASREMMSIMMNPHHMSHHNMTMTMPTEPSIVGDHFYSPNSHYITSMGTKYQDIVAVTPTNNPEIPVSQMIKMELFGYMDHFIWFINGVPEYNAHPIELKPGKKYRFIFTNNSMMHHPMHIHGHWFILRKGQGRYDPLLHTIDVPPGATITADVETDASGQWFFHCHMLYHMITGMSRVFQYSTLIEITKKEVKPKDIVRQTAYHNRPIVRVDEVRPIDKELVKHPMGHPAGFWLASFLDIAADPFHNDQQLTYKGLYGPDYHKLELYTNDAEVYKGTLQNADIDIFYWHLISQFWAIKAGINYFNEPAKAPYWQTGVGVEGLMPYFIDTNARVYFYSGSVKLDLELSRDTQIANNFLIRAGIRTIAASKTVNRAVIGSGLNELRYTVRPYYRLAPGINAFIEYVQETDYGQFKAIEKKLGDQTSVSTISLGLAVLL